MTLKEIDKDIPFDRIEIENVGRTIYANLYNPLMSIFVIVQQTLLPRFIAHNQNNIRASIVKIDLGPTR